MHCGDMENEMRPQPLQSLSKLIGASQIERNVSPSRIIRTIERPLLARRPDDLVAATQKVLHEVAAVLAIATEHQRA
jgi:hypothetical protein